MRLRRPAPTSGTPARRARRSVDARVRPDFRDAVVCAVLAIVAVTVAHAVGGVHAAALHNRLIAYGCAAAFVVFGVAATRRAADGVAQVSLRRAGPTAATPLRLAMLLLGYIVVGLTTLDLLAVPIGRLLVGGAVTGVILGIAAQQTLSNVFAGLVLLFARPYVPGEAIRIHSGPLGGTLDGTVTTVGLLYTTLRTAEGTLNIPNGGLLAAAVGPLPASDAVGAEPAAVETRAPGAGSTAGHPTPGPAATGAAAGVAPGTTVLMPVVSPAPVGSQSTVEVIPPAGWSEPTIAVSRGAEHASAPDGSGGPVGGGDGRPDGTTAALEAGVAGTADDHEHGTPPTPA